MLQIKNLKIGTLLVMGFAAVLFLVALLGIISYRQSDRIHAQTELLYNHPVKVRKALGEINADILKMRLATRDLMLATNEEERKTAIENSDLASADLELQFGILRGNYLGPISDVEEAYHAFISWNSLRDDNKAFVLSGDIEKVKERVKPEGDVGIVREEMLEKIKKIDDFAQAKTVSLFENSNKLSSNLNMQLLIMVIGIILLVILINYVLLRIVRNPLKELTLVTKKFREGNFSERCLYNANNELGDLSLSFNQLAGKIQRNLKLNKETAYITGLMLKEEDASNFFSATLNALSSLTGSQMAAVYLLNQEQSQFICFDSIGLDGQAREFFNANSPEGEFGFVLSNPQIQHLKILPEETKLIFHTVSASFVPREIITIPILSGERVIAIISLATINTFKKQSVKLIRNVQDALSARIEGILAFKKISEFSKQLNEQNKELEQQSREMAMQTAELSEYNTELELQKQQLDKASQLKSTFLSNMSHELRTPLNSVIALSGVLGRKLKKLIPDDEYSYLEVIERNGKHLLSLINNILDISRIEAGREEIEISEFNICSLLDDVVQMIHPQARNKEITLINVSAREIVTIKSDPHKCRHIFQNLIGNAVKFTESGKVEVSVRENNSKIEIQVSDTGIGISDEHQPHIFDEFRQADGSTSRKFGGTGLGLAIAKKYAHLLGGEINVKSIVGSGSEFTLTLPVNYSSENSSLVEMNEGSYKYPITPSPSLIQSGENTKTILIVEDSEPAIIQVKDILEESGYQIIFARDGAEALQIISHTIPNAMILDLMLPGIDGFEVLAAVRNAEQTAEIPVLVLTAKHISKEELKFLKRNNVHQLVQKGDVNREELLKAIESMIPSKENKTPEPRLEKQNLNGKPTVLVVEDNPDNMITVRAILADKYVVMEAINGTEGISMAKKHRPNLILMDIALPGMDGIEAYKNIKSDPSLLNIPVIALTASAMKSDRETILSHGFDAYIAKPIEEEIFFRTLNEVLYGK